MANKLKKYLQSSISQETKNALHQLFKQDQIDEVANLTHQDRKRTQTLINHNMHDFLIPHSRPFLKDKEYIILTIMWHSSMPSDIWFDITSNDEFYSISLATNNSTTIKLLNRYDIIFPAIITETDIIDNHYTLLFNNLTERDHFKSLFKLKFSDVRYQFKDFLSREVLRQNMEVSGY